MLQCGTNFKGTLPENCRSCSVKDDENHRLNECTMWQERNRSLSTTKCDFQDVFSDSYDKLETICDEIENLWELKYSKGRMRIN